MELYDLLLANNVIKNEHCVLRSGKHSEIYAEKIRITLNPYLYNSIIKELTDNIMRIYKYADYDVITGPATAGIAFASPASLLLSKPFIFPEKENRNGNNFGFRKDYKDFICRRRIVLIEDIITTGSSIKKLIDLISYYGGIPKAVFCILNRNNNLFKITGELYKEQIPIYSLISKDIPSFDKKDCPICSKNMTNS